MASGISASATSLLPLTHRVFNASMPISEARHVAAWSGNQWVPRMPACFFMSLQDCLKFPPEDEDSASLVEKVGKTWLDVFPAIGRHEMKDFLERTLEKLVETLRLCSDLEHRGLDARIQEFLN